MAYNLIITRHTDSLLQRLVSYLLEQKKNPQAADHLVLEIGDIYDRLEENPVQFPLSRDPYLASRKYRIAVTAGMNYTLAYKVDGSNVIVYGVFHGSENYPAKLS